MPSRLLVSQLFLAFVPIITILVFVVEKVARSEVDLCILERAVSKLFSKRDFPKMQGFLKESNVLKGKVRNVKRERQRQGLTLMY